MTSLDPSGWPPDDGPPRRGRHRARHTAAAPDSYAGDGYPVDDGHGLSEADHPYPAGAPEARDRYPDRASDARSRQGFRDGAGARARRRRAGPAEAATEPAMPAWAATEPAGLAGAATEPAMPAGAATEPAMPAGAATEPAGPAAAAPKRRAGRNLPAAIAVGVSLGSVVVASLFVWRLAFLGVIIAAVAIGVIEMARAVRATGAQPPVTPLLVGGAAMACLAWFSGPSALALGLLLTVLATLVWRLGDGPVGYHRDVLTATLIAVYIPFLAGFAALLAAPADGATRVMVMLVAVVVSDTAGYVSGVFLGRRKLAPSVSPKKTWEGLAGSLIATAVGGAVALPILLHVAWWWGLLFGLAVSAAAVLGDLAESLLKRDLGVKDMSSLLPGHGGLMDRLDSILFAAPTAYLLLYVLAPPTQ